MNPTQSPTVVARIARLARDRAFIVKAMKFGMVGAVNAVVDYSIFLLCYYHFGLPILGAQIIAWTISVTGSYTMNSMVTFAAESGRKLRAKTYLSFIVVQFAGFLANTATVLIGQLLVPVWAAKLVAIGASFVVNFTLSNFVVFRRKHH